VENFRKNIVVNHKILFIKNIILIAMNFLYFFQYIFIFSKTEGISFSEKKEIFLVNFFWITKNILILLDHIFLYFYFRRKIRNNINLDENDKIIFSELLKINKEELIENLKNILVEYSLFLVFKSWYYKVYFLNIIRSFASLFDEFIKDILNY
jgi:hypothetical protein